MNAKEIRNLTLFVLFVAVGLLWMSINYIDKFQAGIWYLIALTLSLVVLLSWEKVFGMVRNG